MRNSYSSYLSSPGSTETPQDQTNSLSNEYSEIQINTISTSDLHHGLNPDLGQSRNTSIEMDNPGNEEFHGAHLGVPSTNVRQNILTLFSEARNQLGRNTSSISVQRTQNSLTFQLEQSVTETEMQIPSSNNNLNQSQHHHYATSTSNQFSPTNPRNIRSWRMNLNNVLSFSSAPSTEAIRSLITNSANFRYNHLNSNDVSDNTQMPLHQNHHREGDNENTVRTEIYTDNRPPRGNLLWNDSNISNMQANNITRENYSVNGSSFLAPSSVDASINMTQNGTSLVSLLNRNQNTTSNRNTLQEDEDNNVISDMFVKVLSHFVRYLPFICILFVKFVHDHLLGILDLLLLHGTMYQVNKSLRDQVAKFSQKSFAILFRDFSWVGLVVAYRFLLASSTLDPFGLLISPPSYGVTLELAEDSDNNKTRDKLAIVLSSYLRNVNTVKDEHSVAVDNTVTITRAISVGVLLYYVAINDLIVKLITILVKISITFMPTSVIRHKPRARMYVVVEYLSQLYRCLAPVRQWLMFLFESYSGLEVISGILFSSFYMGAKGFEFVERGKSLKKALIIFLRNLDYERKPTKDELEAAGTFCPICHDAYNTPVVLECGHIFCDDCVGTWFKREQTCPMCRAKVTEDPTWQDGSTTFFYQLC